MDDAPGIVNVLVISGSMGSGKATLMGEISDLLTAADIRHAAIELDTLALGHFPPGAENLQSRNLSAMWRHSADLGISTLVISGAIESEARRDELLQALPNANFVICRLRAPVRTMEQRVRLREPGMLQEQVVARVQVLEAELNATNLEDFSIDNDTRSITDVAREVLRRVKWL